MNMRAFAYEHVLFGEQTQDLNTHQADALLLCCCPSLTQAHIEPRALKSADSYTVAACPSPVCS